MSFPVHVSMSPCRTSYRGEMTPHLFSLSYGKSTILRGERVPVHDVHCDVHDQNRQSRCLAQGYRRQIDCQQKQPYAGRRIWPQSLAAKGLLIYGLGWGQKARLPLSSTTILPPR